MQSKGLTGFEVMFKAGESQGAIEVVPRKNALTSGRFSQLITRGTVCPGPGAGAAHQ